ncbi:nucleotide-binding universal stress UspA family protein [Tenacibaculum adriaticum]|uniref:Nucleotide-binding universal stress UspA family protein n=1 Tax=Tenacibaculum adriaticum TaxID=413713 RepID=A0A5S5DW88_9FLAO|nr:universal stress protein [Tenacibaculum adriaticum]TYQ00241.1 nucleotide-binding universal stress UspA family protein [Tenacibaculum adriaticum]
MKVLLPTDFSNNAFNAIVYAVELLKEKECIFYLLNTYTPIVYNYDYRMSAGGGLGKLRDVIKDHSVNKLKELKSKLEDKYVFTNHSFEIISSFNTFSEEIKERVEELAIDVIIMGTKGASGVKEVLFGSNTVHIIKNSKCPVIAVPDEYSFEKPKNILFPTDFNIDYSEDQLLVYKTIANLYNAKLHILHASRDRDLNSKEKINKEKLQTILGDLKHQTHIVRDQEIPLAINEFQNNHHIELLMMVNNKHSFFENLFFKPVINQIGFHLSTPFLVIPTKEKNQM